MNESHSLTKSDNGRTECHLNQDEDQLIRHRSAYKFFRDVIDRDLKGSLVGDQRVRIVDLGFGSGYGCALLSVLTNSEIVGVDIAEECRDYARQRYWRHNVTYIVEDLGSFVSSMAQFDYVVSLGALENVEDSVDSIARLRFSKRVFVGVPCDEESGNIHHLITGITEREFDGLENCELFYKDIEGRIFAGDDWPGKADMIMVVISDPALPKVRDFFDFPIEPVVDNYLELESESQNQQKQYYYSSREDLLAAAERSVRHSDVVLDIGTGIVPMNYFRPSLHIMVEPWQEYSDILSYRHQGDKSVIVKRCDALSALESLADSSVDTVFLLDVIEHIEKEVGSRIIGESKRVAREQIVIFTPLGFMPQHVEAGGPDAWGLSGAEFQEHRSGWVPEDFEGDWVFHICEQYHYKDFKEEKLERPYGAFFAIYNCKSRTVARPKRLVDIRQPLPSEKEADQLKTNLNLVESELAANRGALAQRENELNACGKEVATCYATITNLSSELAGCGKEVAACYATIANMDIELASRAKEVAACYETIANLSNERDSLRSAMRTPVRTSIQMVAGKLRRVLRGSG